MPTLIVLFNLKKDASAQDYERWVRETDVPVIRQQKSVEDYRVLKVTGLLDSQVSPPYQYFEVLDFNDLEQFAEDVGSAAVQQIDAELQGFADDPVFVLTKPLT